MSFLIHVFTGRTKPQTGNDKATGKAKTVRTLLTPNTSIGQHFLKNPAVVDK